MKTAFLPPGNSATVGLCAEAPVAKTEQIKAGAVSLEVRGNLIVAVAEWFLVFAGGGSVERRRRIF